MMNSLLAFCLLTSPGSGEGFGCDTSNIHWVLPPDFETAVGRAKEEHRLLLIKGVSFNIDEAGAACATKGTW